MCIRDSHQRAENERNPPPPHAVLIRAQNAKQNEDQRRDRGVEAHGDIHMIKPLTRPRRRGGVHSIASGTAEVYPPPRKTPPRKRSATIENSVPGPSVTWPGTTATSRVVMATPAIVIFVVVVRPIRSAIGPKIAAPSGRPISVATKIRPAFVATCSVP